MSIEACNRTHFTATANLEQAVEEIKQKILSRGDLPHATVAYQMEILEQLCSFPLGRFILQRQGANGLWTDYMITHPDKGKISGLNNQGNRFCPLEEFFLNRCPVVVAHQERFKIFQRLMQQELKDNMILASIPCGMMRDLLTLDFSSVKNIHLIGIDIDEESLMLAKELAKETNISSVEFLHQDAWQIDFDQSLDLITSSGLNVYEPDPNKVRELYARFFAALKPGGLLITSVLTYPPDEAWATDWDLTGISSEDLLLDKVLHKNLLNVKWRNFRSCNELKHDFEEVGFGDVSIYYDKHRVFPTIHARRPFH